MTGDELKQRRLRLDLTQTELAERLGLTRDAISKMEAGVRPIVEVSELAIEHLFCIQRKKKAATAKRGKRS